MLALKIRDDRLKSSFVLEELSLTTSVGREWTCTPVFYTEGGVPWDFLPLSSSFPPQALLTSAIHFELLSHLNGIRSPADI